MASSLLSIWQSKCLKAGVSRSLLLWGVKGKMQLRKSLICEYKRLNNRLESLYLFSLFLRKMLSTFCWISLMFLFSQEVCTSDLLDQEECKWKLPWRSKMQIQLKLFRQKLCLSASQYWDIRRWWTRSSLLNRQKFQENKTDFFEWIS